MVPPSDLAVGEREAETRRRVRAERLLAVVTGLVVAGLLALSMTPKRSLMAAFGVRPDDVLDAVLANPELADAALQIFLESTRAREAIENRLESKVDAIYDAHMDPEVGRVLLPNLVQAPSLGVAVTSNAFGMRERSYSWERPPHVTRVVVLGDSFVFGHGASADARVGVHLERLLEPYCPTKQLEVLNLGVSSWNLLAECAYLRRQLKALDPDLVVQIAYRNDLADCDGVRGMGVAAAYSPQAWMRGESRVSTQAVSGFYDAPIFNLINAGLDWESRERYRRAAEALGELAGAVESIGAKYVLLTMWGRNAPIVREHLLPHLRPDQTALVADAFMVQPENWTTPTNRHWGTVGGERMANAIVALIDERGLLPGWEVEATEAQRAEAAFVFGGGEAEAEDFEDFEEYRRVLAVGPVVRFPPDHRRMAAQLTGGVDREGFVAQHATVCLAVGGPRLAIEGELLDNPALTGARMTVLVDEVEVGSFALDDPEALPAEFELPPAVASREFVSVRLHADDFAYLNPRGKAGTFRFGEIRLE